MHHVATVAHAIDLHTGELRHATALVGAHTGTHSDYHAARGSDTDNDVCSIAAALHQAAHSGTASPAVLATSAVVCAPPSSIVLALATTPVYRFAPKTSPPARS